MRTEGRDGTWLDPEELAYPLGTISSSRRRAKVMCADERVRTAVVGIPDTFFTIPAEVRIKDKRIRGYISMNDGRFVFVSPIEGDIEERP